MRRINYSFYVLVFLALTVGLIIIALLNKVFPLFTSKTLFLCQKFITPVTNLFISNIMLEVPRSLPNTLILAIGGVLGTGLLSFLLQFGKTHLLLKKILINRIDISKDLNRVIATLGLTNQIILVKNNNLFSFCCGIFSPYIVVTTGLVQSLTDKELEAVLLHEQSHLVSRDPIKVLIGKTFSSMFFFLPVFRELHKNIEAVNELLADRWAINHQQKTTFLCGALKKILASPQIDFATVSSASGPNYFEIRIHRLVNPGIKNKFRLSLVSLITTFLFIFLSWFLLQTPASAFHSVDQSCSDQCHLHVEQSTSYVPARLNLAEKKCD